MAKFVFRVPNLPNLQEFPEFSGNPWYPVATSSPVLKIDIS